MHIKLFLTAIIIFLAGCSSSNKISNSWKNPDAEGEYVKFQTVAVFGMVKDQELRKDVEETLASRMVNTIAVPSYKMVSNEELSDLKALKQKLSDRGMEGALILSVVDVKQRTTYSSYSMYPSSYYTFGGYYNYAWNYMYDPYVYVNTNVYVDLEIVIYSLKKDMLIWYGESTSVNPQNIQETLFELAEAVKNTLIEDGLLNPAQ